MSRLFRSLSFRLALIYAGLFCLSVALLLAVVYWFRVALPFEHAGAVVDGETAQIERIIDAQGLDAARAALERRARSGTMRKPFHALIAADGEVLSANLPSWSRTPSPRLILIEADAFANGAEIDYNALVRDRVLADGTRLMVGRDVDDLVHEKHFLQTAALWILGGTVVLGLSGGMLMSRAIGARIEMVTSAARTVMDGDLSGRVPLRGTGDDFDRLGETLNLMLSRNQTLFEAVRRVSDNVAHELRTPLARLVGKLEAAEQLAQADASVRIAIDEAIVEANRLRQIFAALARISRLEDGRHALRRHRTDVVQLLEDVIEFYQPEADRRGVQLVLAAARPIIADLDLDLVFQAMSNLLDNALKYVGPGARVVVGAEFGSGAVAGRRAASGTVLRLWVADDGPGLDPAEFDRVTEQFYRGAAANTTSGEGLGLSMVAAIAHVHGGDIALADNAPGLRVTLTLPKVATPL